MGNWSISSPSLSLRAIKSSSLPDQLTPLLHSSTDVFSGRIIYSWLLFDQSLIQMKEHNLGVVNELLRVGFMGSHRERTSH